MTGHVHDPFRCPAHAPGCDCPELEGCLCNPYHVAGHCPDELDVMPDDPRYRETASRGEMPKNSGSNPSIPSRNPPKRL